LQFVDFCESLFAHLWSIAHQNHAPRTKPMKESVHLGALFRKSKRTPLSWSANRGFTNAFTSIPRRQGRVERC